jgi:hypothetical protein
VDKKLNSNPQTILTFKICKKELLAIAGLVIPSIYEVVLE